MPIQNIPGTQVLVNIVDIPLRAEDPPLWNFEKERPERTFVKKNSVFADWVEDDDSRIISMLQADNKFSKI